MENSSYTSFFIEDIIGGNKTQKMVLPERNRRKQTLQAGAACCESKAWVRLALEEPFAPRCDKAAAVEAREADNEIEVVSSSEASDDDGNTNLCAITAEKLHAVLTMNPVKHGADLKRRYPRERTTFTASQLKFLEELFLLKKYLTLVERSKVALQLKLSEKQIKTWFQNRRTKYRRQKSIPSQSRMDHSPQATATRKLSEVSFTVGNLPAAAMSPSYCFEFPHNDRLADWMATGRNVFPSSSSLRNEPDHHVTVKPETKPIIGCLSTDCFRDLRWSCVASACANRSIDNSLALSKPYCSLRLSTC